MKSISSLASAVIALGPVVSAKEPCDGLNRIAQLSGRVYGTSTGPHKFSDLTYASIINDTNEFSWITTENEFKWGLSQPTQGVWDFINAEKIIDVAIAHGQHLRGHCLVWHIEQPAWLEKGTWTPDELESLMEIHINRTVGTFAGKIDIWDVVNEVIADQPPGEMRTSFWYNTLGEEYIDKAFHFARAADPNVELWINDYWTEASGPKADGYYNLITRLLDRGVPVQGIGFQCHFDVGKVPEYEDLLTNMQRFADLDLKIGITEIDIRITLPVTDDQLKQQALDFGTLTKVCMNIDGCEQIIAWDFSYVNIATRRRIVRHIV